MNGEETGQMELVQALLDRLRDGDGATRIETLRVLAMVEETAALRAVAWLYQHDPDAQVRQTAEWAGRLLWQAHERGHSTDRALRQRYDPRTSQEHEDLFLAQAAQEAAPDLSGSGRSRRLQRETQAEQERLAHQRALLDALHGEEDGQAGEPSLSDLASDLLDG